MPDGVPQLTDKELIRAVKRRLRVEAHLWGHNGELTPRAQNKLNGAVALAFIGHEHMLGKAYIEWRFADGYSEQQISEVIELSGRTIRRRIAAAWASMCENIPPGLAESLLKGVSDGNTNQDASEVETEGV